MDGKISNLDDIRLIPVYQEIAIQQNISEFDTRLLTYLGINEYKSKDVSTSVKFIADNLECTGGYTKYGTKTIERMVERLEKAGLINNVISNNLEFEGEELNSIYLSKQGQMVYQTIELKLGGVLK